MVDSERPTIFIVDDDPGIVTALTRLVRTAGFLAEGYSGVDEFLSHHRPDAPGCVILDVAMGVWNGLDVQKRLNAEGRGRPIIFISGQSELQTSVQAMKAGAVDFLTKPVDANDLFAAVDAALEKDRSARRQFEEKDVVSHHLARLTPREYEVLLHVVQGKLNKQIAFELGIAEKTAKVHRARVMSKLGARNLAELVRMAEHLGIVTLVEGKKR